VFFFRFECGVSSYHTNILFDERFMCYQSECLYTCTCVSTTPGPGPLFDERLVEQSCHLIILNQHTLYLNHELGDDVGFPRTELLKSALINTLRVHVIRFVY